MSASHVIPLADAEATAALGARIAPLLKAGDAVLLYGPLGMGKSTLARGLIRALAGPHEDVPSPTFTLVQFYETTPPVAHFDLYRLTRADEAFEIGLDEALDDGVAIVEWPERLGEDVSWLIGENRLCITLSEEGDDPETAGRLATVLAAGSWETRIDHVFA